MKKILDNKDKVQSYYRRTIRILNGSTQATYLATRVSLQ
jgi:hypothetical protein